MPAWFDLMSLDDKGPEDEAGIKKSREYVQSLIKKEVDNGIDPSRIVLGGFSQGGALALYTSLTCDRPVAGVIALSCWLPLHREFPTAIRSGHESIPLLQCHGDCDPVVPYRWGQLTSTSLKAFVKQHEFKTYKGLMHSSSEAEMADIRAFLNKLLPN